MDPLQLSLTGGFWFEFLLDTPETHRGSWRRSWSQRLGGGGPTDGWTGVKSLGG